MSDTKDADAKRPLSLGQGGKLELKRPVESGQVRQSFPHGRTKTVTVEVRKKRVVAPAANDRVEPAPSEITAKGAPAAPGAAPQRRPVVLPHGLTAEERAGRVRALQGAIKAGEEHRRQAEIDAIEAADREFEAERRAAEEASRRVEEETKRKVEEESKRKSDEETKRKTADEDRRAADVKRKAEEDSRREVAERAGKAAAAKVAALSAAGKVKVEPEPEEDAPRRRLGVEQKKSVVAPPRRDANRRRASGKLTVTRVLNTDEDERTRSLASVRRAREREKQRAMLQAAEPIKVVRDVIVPEHIAVQELANRMAERGSDVIKALMRMGVMATINQMIDADTAELVVTEFGHKIRRVSESDIEIGLGGDADAPEALTPRPPVVTIMGHVDHGKTSLLDALRGTDVASGEAGGITQHIGAYQVHLKSGQRITFIDTPGHQAFTAMRARGANVTDIVVLVVAADDGIKEQTVEAIRHAKAARVPILVAINKMDKPDAKPERVRQEMLQHELVVEELGGDILDVEVSALKKTGLDKLEEAILLQAEILDLKANPNRPATGAVIEAKLERGRGPVATVLIQAGTLKVGDIFVSGSEWGRVRALLDERGQTIGEAGPATPVEVLGLNGVPLAGDDFIVAENETRARDIADYRQRVRRDKQAAGAGRGTLEQLFAQAASGGKKELAVVVKSDVQGSLEAITASLEKLGTDEVVTRVLHAAVGGISESDVILAKASNAVIIGFNVRANPQARELARRDGVEIRY
ncbi:MAG TPA: translation initiation factor IF-2, partial [Stellaceae bacterium]|nr:translation initiation factor IF-2 [Stellaceae bacterium]